MRVQPNRGEKPERPKPNWAALRRAMSYNRHYGSIMLIAYGTLVIATLALARRWWRAPARVTAAPVPLRA